MRLSLRLTVERTGRAGGLGLYLDDPVLLFVPARLLMGVDHHGRRRFVFAAWTGVDDFKDPLGPGALDGRIRRGSSSTSSRCSSCATIPSAC